MLAEALRDARYSNPQGFVSFEFGPSHPYFLRLRGQWHRRNREPKLPHPFLIQLRRNKSLLHQVAELIPLPNRCRKLRKLQQLPARSHRRETQCPRSSRIGIVQQIKIERRRFTQRSTNSPLLRHRPYRQQRIANRPRIALEIPQIIDNPRMILNRRSLPPRDRRKVQLIRYSRILHVVLPGVVALLPQRSPKFLRRRERPTESPTINELVIRRHNLLMVDKVIARICRLTPNPSSLRRTQLMQHQRVVIRSSAAFHLAKLRQRLPLRRLVRKLRWRFIKLVVPLIPRALMLIPPPAPLLLIAPVQLRIPGRKPRLRRLPRWRNKSIVQHNAAARVFRAHRFQHRNSVGILQVRANLVLQAVLNHRRMRPERFHHLYALHKHVTLRELVRRARRLFHHNRRCIRRDTRR